MAINSYKILKTIYRDIEGFRHCWNTGSGYKPLDVELRVNWKCNAKCVMCGLNSYVSMHSDDRKYEMDYGEIVNLLDDLKILGCKSITLSGGEPTLRSDLVEIVSYASQKCRMEVSLNTNGFLLKEGKIKTLLEAGLDSVTFSVDSPTPTVHDEIRGLPGSLDRIATAIKYINDYSSKYKKNIRIFINCVVMKNNIMTMVGFKDLYACCKFHHLNLTPASLATPWDEWTTSNEDLRVTVVDVLNFKKTVLPELQKADWSLNIQDPFGDELEEIERNCFVIYSNRPERCFVPLVHLVIQNNGDVIPCCYAPDEFVMGNVLRQSVEEIWTSQKYIGFRHKCRNTALKMCPSCLQYETLNSKLGGKII